MPATIYVVPSGKDGGDGSVSNPFVLQRGKEYELNRLIRSKSRNASAVEILFEDGIYNDVRLQILREGIGSDALYLDGIINDATSNSKTSPVRNRCNSGGHNCRVNPQDFTIGAQDDVALTFRAQHTGMAILDGSGLVRDDKDPAATAIDITGAWFGVAPSEVEKLHSRPISNVSVVGLTIQNYRNGVSISFASNITLDSCLIKDIGSGPQASAKKKDFGAFAIGVNGNSNKIVISRNTIMNIRDEPPANGADAFLPSLMHSLYLGNSRDIIVLSNKFLGSSGPMIKFSYYGGDENHDPFPNSPSDRRNFFLGNLFRLQQTYTSGHPLPVFRGQQAFIEENSIVANAHGSNAPEAGAVFMCNRFDARFEDDIAADTYLLREELPPQMPTPSYPAWFFLGNTITGIPKTNLSAFRKRGTTLDASSVVRQNLTDIQADKTGFLEFSTDRNLTESDVERELHHLLEGPLAARDHKEDDSVQKLFATILKQGWLCKS